MNITCMMNIHVHIYNACTCRQTNMQLVFRVLVETSISYQSKGRLDKCKNGLIPVHNSNTTTPKLQKSTYSKCMQMYMKIHVHVHVSVINIVNICPMYMYMYKYNKLCLHMYTCTVYGTKYMYIYNNTAYCSAMFLTSQNFRCLKENKLSLIL